MSAGRTHSAVIDGKWQENWPRMIKISISPYNSSALSSRHVRRIEKPSDVGILSECITKFSEINISKGDFNSGLSLKNGG